MKAEQISWFLFFFGIGIVLEVLGGFGVWFVLIAIAVRMLQHEGDKE